MSGEMRNGEEMPRERALPTPEPQAVSAEDGSTLEHGSPGPELLEFELLEALGHFKASVHGWSNEVCSRAMQNRPQLVLPVQRRAGRLAAGWALASLMAAGAVSGLLYERHQKQELAQIEHEHLLEQQQQMAAQRQQAEEDLLAKVESDISREVPSAMEPLAQLMTSDGTQTANASQ